MRHAQTRSCPGPGTSRQRLFAWALAHVGTKLEKFVAPYKGRLLTDLSGTVLEIGPGTGANLRYLAKERVRWLGIEPNPSMYPYLEREATSWTCRSTCARGLQSICQRQTRASMRW